MSITTRLRVVSSRLWRSLWTELPQPEKRWLSAYAIASHMTGGDPTATLLLARQIVQAHPGATLEGAPVSLHDYRRLIDGLATLDAIPAWITLEILDGDSIRLEITENGVASPLGRSLGVVLTAAQLDELGAAVDGALDVLTPPEADDGEPAGWDERAAGYVSHLAAQMSDTALADEVYQRLRDEIHGLAPDDRAELADALLVRAAATLATFRDHVSAGETLVAYANQAAE